MKCPNCEGRGWNHNKKYWKAKTNIFSSEYLMHNPTIKCNNCKGTGFVIGNVRDILDFLKHLEVVKFKNDKEYQQKVKQCIDSIEK